MRIPTDAVVIPRDKLTGLTLKPKLYSRVVVNRDIPEENLRHGDVATVIEYLEHPHGGEEGAILEIFNVLGESLDIATVPVSAIEELSADYVPAARTTKVSA